MAVGDFVKIDNTITTARLANDLLAMVRTLRLIIEQVEKVKGMMDHMTVAQIEEQYGITGQGATVQTLVAGCRSAVRSATTLETIDRLG